VLFREGKSPFLQFAAIESDRAFVPYPVTRREEKILFQSIAPFSHFGTDKIDSPSRLDLENLSSAALDSANQIRYLR